MLFEDGNTEVTSTSQPEEPVTPPAEPPVTPPADPNPAAEEPIEDRTFSRADVTKILRKRLERDRKGFFEKLGIKDASELDGYLQERTQMSTELEDLRNKNSELVRTNSFLKNNINPEKYDDIVAHFKGSGIEFSEEELIKQLATHPEWLNKPVVEDTPAPQASVKVLGPGRGVNIPESEEEKMNRVFGFKK